MEDSAVVVGKDTVGTDLLELLTIHASNVHYTQYLVDMSGRAKAIELQLLEDKQEDRIGTEYTLYVNNGVNQNTMGHELEYIYSKLGQKAILAYYKNGPSI